jgi:hypothetical protein
MHSVRVLAVFLISGILFISSVAAQSVAPLFLHRSAGWHIRDNGTAPEATWKETSGVPPTPWRAGVGDFGYGDDGNPANPDPGRYGTKINKTLISGSTYHPTTYFKRTFTTPVGTFTTLVLHYFRDDGIVVYLNGISIHRENMPDITPTHGTLAKSNIAREFEIQEQVALINLTALKPIGQINVLAVEIHQSSLAGGAVGDPGYDMAFDMAAELSSALPHYGFAKPGISTKFNGGSSVTSGFHRFHRPELVAPWNPAAVELQWKVTELSRPSTVLARTINSMLGPGLLPLDSDGTPNWAFTVNYGKAIFETELIDISNYNNVGVSLRFQGETALRSVNNITTRIPYAATDFVTFQIITSKDGYYSSPTTLPWADFRPSGGSNIIYPTTESDVTNSGNLVPEFYLKKVFVAPNDASDILTSVWTAPSYTGDTNWKSSTQGKGLGYDIDQTGSTSYAHLIDPGLEVRAEMQNRTASAYMRIKFPRVLNKSQYSSARLRIKVDDGFAAFLNGSLVAQFNQATTTPFTRNSTAPGASVEADSIVWKDYSLPLALGLLSESSDNVLAIQVFNAGNASSDLVCWPVLQLGKQTPSTFDEIDDMLTDGSLLSDMDTWKTLVTPPGLIPNDAKSFKLRITISVDDAGTSFSSRSIHAIYIDDIAISGEAFAGDTYEAYANKTLAAFSAQDRHPNADVDADGRDNLLEYATGTDPLIPNPAISSPQIANMISLGDQFSYLNINKSTG